MAREVFRIVLRDETQRTVLSAKLIETDDTDQYPSGWRYSYHYGTLDGETTRRYDNENMTPGRHELHTADDVEKIEYPDGFDPHALLRKWLEEIGVDVDELADDL
jgi:hypothetical protein